MTPSPLNKTVEQSVAVFHCQHRSSDDITWRVNAMSVNSPNFWIEKVPLSGGGFYSSLSINTLVPGYNQTIIVECVAILFFERFPFQFSGPVMLLIQGVIRL